MKSSPAHGTGARRLALAVLALVVLIGIGYAATSTARERRRALVAERGAQVMPFDLDATTHHFEPVTDGGIQQVTAHNPGDAEQIGLIRAHLQEEARKFRQGDFSDPAAIHDETMPGLAELRAGAARIEVRYKELPAGAQLSYITADTALVEALHRWFEAQVSDHGKHAMPGMQH